MHVASVGKTAEQPGVAGALVHTGSVGRTAEQPGAVGAVVQVAPGKNVTEEELKAHVGQLLAAFKVPIRIEIRHEPLPRNANGKILKTVLREDIKKFVGQGAA